MSDENRKLDDEMKRILQDLQKMYLENLPAKISLIREAQKTRDLVVLKTEFHKLKGAGKTYGFPEISEIGLIAERLCKDLSEANDAAGVKARSRGIELAVSLLETVLHARASGAPFEAESSPELIELRRCA